MPTLLTIPISSSLPDEDRHACLQVQDHTEEAASAFWVRFTVAGGATLELGVTVSVAAGPPHSWRLTCVDGDTETQGIDETGSVRCGQFFRVEVEALDSFNNRCAALRPAQQGVSQCGTFCYR